MKKTYYLNILRIALFAAFVQQISLVADTRPIAQAPVTYKERLEVLAQTGITMARPIDYGISTGTRIITFLTSLVGTSIMIYLGNNLDSDPLQNNNLKQMAKGSQNFYYNAAFFAAICIFLSGLMTLLNISSIRFLSDKLQLPAHCLERGFFGTIYYFFLPPALAGVEGIAYNQIAYADLIVIQETLTARDETSGKKDIWGVEIQHKHITGSEKKVYYCTLVIVLKDGGLYKIRADYCQGYNSFEMILGLLKKKGIPLIQKRNYSFRD